MLVPKLPKLNRHRNKSGLQYYIVAALPTNPPECSHKVWSRNGLDVQTSLLMFNIDHLRNDVMQHTRTPFPTIPGSNCMGTFRWIGRGPLNRLKGVMRNGSNVQKVFRSKQCVHREWRAKYTREKNTGPWLWKECWVPCVYFEPHSANLNFVQHWTMHHQHPLFHCVCMSACVLTPQAPLIGVNVFCCCLILTFKSLPGSCVQHRLHWRFLYEMKKKKKKKTFPLLLIDSSSAQSKRTQEKHSQWWSRSASSESSAGKPFSDEAIGKPLLPKRRHCALFYDVSCG